VGLALCCSNFSRAGIPQELPVAWKSSDNNRSVAQLHTIWRAFSQEMRRFMHIENLHLRTGAFQFIPQIESFDITQLKNLMTGGDCRNGMLAPKVTTIFHCRKKDMNSYDKL